MFSAKTSLDVEKYKSFVQVLLTEKIYIMSLKESCEMCMVGVFGAFVVAGWAEMSKRWCI